MDDAVARRFTEETEHRLLALYLPRLRKALETLPDADLWWRPHEKSTSIGVLLRHLEGNVRQWILSGVGGLPDRRTRSREFDGAETQTRAELLEQLERTVEEACAVVRGLDVARLLAPRTIQGFPTDGLAAIYHVLEHMGWHLGQIVWIAKMRAGAGHGIAFYDDTRLDRPPASVDEERHPP